MEYALGVQVGQTAGDLRGQFHPRGPTQVFVAVYELLQVPTIDVLEENKDTHVKKVEKKKDCDRRNDAWPPNGSKTLCIAIFSSLLLDFL